MRKGFKQISALLISSAVFYSSMGRAEEQPAVVAQKQRYEQAWGLYKDSVATAINDIEQHIRRRDLTDRRQIGDAAWTTGLPLTVTGAGVYTAGALVRGIGTKYFANLGVGLVRVGGAIVGIGLAMTGVGVAIDVVVGATQTASVMQSLIGPAEAATLGAQFKTPEGVMRFIKLRPEQKYAVATVDPEMARFVIDLDQQVKAAQAAFLAQSK